MTHPTKHNFYDRVQVIQDERERIIVLSDFNLELPQVGIFDEPTRCYKVNKEWAKIITGAIDLLCEVAVWKYAEHEGYLGIQQIIQFLIGEDCMDCTDVENCLSTSQIIANMQALIAANAANITANDADIAALQNADISLQTQINSNDADIAALQNADISLQTQINSNDADITALQNSVAEHENEITVLQGEMNQLLTIDIPQHNLTLQDHETRIDALEAAGGSGGGSASYIKTTNYVVDVTVDKATGSATYVDVPGVAITHEFTKTNALIMVTLSAKKDGAWELESNFRLALGAEVSLAEWEASENAETTVVMSYTFTDVALGQQVIVPQFKSEYANILVLDNRDITYTIIEYDSEPSVPGPTNYLIDFSVSGHGYSEGIDNTGVYNASVGNPDDCYISPFMAALQAIHIIPDAITETTIYNIKFDVMITGSGSGGNTIYCYVKIGGTTLTGYVIPDADWNATWHTIDLAANDPAKFPYTHNPADVIEIYVYSDQSGQPTVEARLDNIVIDVTP